MGPITAQLVDELGFDPDDPTPEACAADVPAGAVVRARVAERYVAVARLRSGRLVVVDDVCPHDGGRISDGYVDGERLVCSRHGWELEVENGHCRRATPCKRRE
jgi:nitrite reductase/ring-hydroxylating ferredoxin subunit